VCVCIIVIPNTNHGSLVATFRNHAAHRLVLEFIRARISLTDDDHSNGTPNGNGSNDHSHCDVPTTPTLQSTHSS
jgi:hypothetical protein